MDTELNEGDVWGEPSDSSTWERIKSVSSGYVYTREFGVGSEWENSYEIIEWPEIVRRMNWQNISCLALKALGS